MMTLMIFATELYTTNRSQHRWWETRHQADFAWFFVLPALCDRNFSGCISSVCSTGFHHEEGNRTKLRTTHSQEIVVVPVLKYENW
jgi:hypothetical protein